MAKMDLNLLKSKFRGSMLGVLMGDCLGRPYEGEKFTKGMRLVLQNSLDKLEGPVYKAPFMQYTDDSVMTKDLAESLIEKKELDLLDIAKRFVQSYYQEPNRGYGPAAITVFEKFRESKFSDILKPAIDQFQGHGSFGNGAAMRVAPVALFCNDNYAQMLDYAKQQAIVTHTHRNGINGALLQAIAIQQSLQINPENEIDVIDFVNNLIEKMNDLEINEERLGLTETQPYKKQLNVVKKLLSDDSDGPNPDIIIRELGNEVTSLRSVPTAIFCFLRAFKPIQGISTENPLRRAIQFSVSLGGDTDTIGSMTGAIAGACYGENSFSKNILHHCESSEKFSSLADELYNINMSNK